MIETNTRKVLIIDDTPEDRVTWRRYLAQETAWRYEFREAETGAEALALYGAELFDCVLLDYALPDMDGLDLLPTLVGAPAPVTAPTVPVVMMTGTGDTSVAVTAMKRGAQDYLSKGRFTPDALIRAVNNAIDKVALIREQQRALTLLRESEERLQLALDAAALGVWVWDISTDQVYWSPECYRVMGVTQFDGTAAAFGSLLHPEDAERVWATVRAAIHHHQVYEAEFRIVRGDGAVRWLYNRGRAEYDAANAPLRVLGIAQDISARKFAELERDELLSTESAARAEAEAANQAKDEFLALVSHELRNPLHLMLGWSRTLRRHADPQVVKTVETIERAAQSQQQLIEDLLDAARLMTGKLRLDPRPLDIAAVVRTSLETARPAATAKDLTLTFTDELAGEQITGDADRLQQVVWNLLSNAVKFTPAGGRVTVRLERRAPHICLSVSDTGKGLAPDLLPHVFERFRQGVGAGSAARRGGLGLGLSLVKQLVELHGGTVHAASDGLGQGATFTVSLPLRAVRGEPLEMKRHEDIVSDSSAFPVAVSLWLKGVRVLVVDDEADARQVVAETLTYGGAEVRAVASAQAAMEILLDQEWHPALLVCDIGLPEEDGYSLLRRVRQLSTEQGGALPAVALTAFNQQQDRLRALQVGFQAHLAKPVEPLELALTVARLLERQAQLAG